jgi:glycosyltransferase involved in cell wall biosynthesis
VAYFAVPDPSYPRNLRIREFVSTRFGAEVDRCDRDVDPRGWRGKLRRFATLVRGSRGASAIVLAEFGTKYALPAWVLARIRGAQLVVDGFVGLHETHIEDWREHPPWSPPALVYRAFDRLAIRCADVYLIDTRVRAAAIARQALRRTQVVSLPVGAPDWATWRRPATTTPDDRLRVLYYGNYIALHGLGTAVQALADPRVRDRVTLTLVGDGRLRPQIVAQLHAAGLDGSTVIVDRVSHAELGDLIAAHDVVLGVFGSSAKAGSVIANKVWQGLACGRLVITQQSPALDEIRDLCPGQLVCVPPADADALAEVLAGLVDDPGRHRVFRDTAARLAGYVDEQYESLAGALGWASHRPATQP